MNSTRTDSQSFQALPWGQQAPHQSEQLPDHRLPGTDPRRAGRGVARNCESSSGHSHAAVVASNVSRTYGTGEASVKALDRVSLEISEGTLVAVMGPSGSGKSTLVHCLAGLDVPDKDPSTRIVVGGQDITGLSDDQLTRFRRDHVGFVFQAFNLVPTLTARQNIELPLSLAGRKTDTERLEALADTLGIRSRLDHRPDEMSGGQQQRVAIARALLPGPAVIIADEPTGALDSTTSHEVLGMLRRSVDEFNQTVVIVTHDPQVARAADRVVRVMDGRIQDDAAAAGDR